MLDLVPLLLAIGREGPLEEDLFLTSFLWEEGKHTEFFGRFLDQVVGERGDLTRYDTPSYRTIFSDELSAALGALLEDSLPAAQARVVVTYTVIVEGVLAEAGYHGYFTALERRGLLPGLREGLGRGERLGSDPRQAVQALAVHLGRVGEHAGLAVLAQPALNPGGVLGARPLVVHERHAVAARVGDAVDRDRDDRAGADLRILHALEAEPRGELREPGVADLGDRHGRAGGRFAAGPRRRRT